MPVIGSVMQRDGILDRDGMAGARTPIVIRQTLTSLRQFHQRASWNRPRRTHKRSGPESVQSGRWLVSMSRKLQNSAKCSIIVRFSAEKKLSARRIGDRALQVRQHGEMLDHPATHCPQAVA
jgi:hypothetical protein